MCKSIALALLTSVLTVGVMASDAKDPKDPKDPAWKATPLMRTVVPDAGKAGDVLTISGEYLDKARVADVYLTTGDSNFRMEILSQSEKLLKVKIPAKTTSGRLRLMTLTAGLEPQFIEQPLVVNVE